MLAMLKPVIYPERLPVVLAEMQAAALPRQLVNGTGDASQFPAFRVMVTNI